MGFWASRKNCLIRKITLISKLWRPSLVTKNYNAQIGQYLLLGKSKSSAAWFHYTSIAPKLACNRNSLFKTLHNWSRDMLNFDFLDKDLGIDLGPHFVYDFSTRMFLMLHSINWPNFIAKLPLLLEILGNMCIAIVCYPGCDVMDFEINFVFLIEPFFLHDQKAMTKT